ncbi:AlpA family transcriptional regulator [Pseudoclavibacter sp. AY1H1]|uniref:helix-turn-helix transcriptional regulator n=1 Tax=Pseudoclavibacter sp. AY1H1 TaxID=2080584 RepID=UPI000CE80B1F|nr:helix-turn-helix domain-containing protein [Pseudoclavibacter sp. AY1H1]PPF39939.1 DNA-binding protein [Pseudoclavibacter sp. AY1H1]
MTTATAEKFLTTDEAAALLNLRPGLLREWHYLDKQDGGSRGPKPRKFGRLVRYPVSAIDAWLAAQDH